MLRKILLGYIVVLIASLFAMMAFADDPKQQGGEYRDGGELASLSTLDLVMMLQIEHSAADSAGRESNTKYYYDIVVEELLLRRDIQSVPLLLLRANDETPVIADHEGKSWIWEGKYNTPVKVKYKARFVLYRLLDGIDYRQMVGIPAEEEINLHTALNYFMENREVIGGRLKRLQAFENTYQEDLDEQKSQEIGPSNSEGKKPHREP